ncbi:hypothetical protein [Pseudomonas sp. Pseusp97]|uniref:hypothetical protein n=1 Tax=Pseudomonas sp. Pseusp97 TaxID=3243065 RepID=UPI0039A43030
MTGDRLKNIGLEKDVWKALKDLCTERECTMSQAVEYLLERSKTKNGKKPGSTDDVGKKPRD